MKRLSTSGFVTGSAVAVGLTVGLLTVGTPATAKQSPAVKCAIALKKAVSKKTSCEFAADEKAESQGTTADFSKCSAKFSAAVTKAQAKGGCPTAVTGAQLESAVDAFVHDIVQMVSGSSPSAAFLD